MCNKKVSVDVIKIIIKYPALRKYEVQTIRTSSIATPTAFNIDTILDENNTICNTYSMFSLLCNNNLSLSLRQCRGVHRVICLYRVEQIG